MNKAAMATVTIASTSLYFGLAIWGEGGFASFWSHPALIGLAFASLMMAIAAPFTRGNLNPGETEDRGNRWVIVAFALIGLADGFAPAWSDRRGLWTMGEAARWPGVLLFVAGCALRMAPVLVLGDRFSGLSAIQPGHKLVTTGLYGLVRNPSYVGMVILTLGWGLAFRSWIGVGLAALLLPPLIARMNSEERLLSGRFGAEYEAYVARTWRLIPWIY